MRISFFIFLVLSLFFVGCSDKSKNSTEPEIETEPNVIWESSYSGTGAIEDKGYSVIEDDSGNFVAVGKQEIDGYIYRPWIIKVDSSGNLLWDLTLDDIEGIATSITELDEFFIISGMSNGPFAAKIRKNGMLMGTYQFDVEDNSADVSIIFNDDSNLILLCKSDLIKLDYDLSIIWQSNYLDSGFEEGFDIAQIESGDIVISGYFNSNYSGYIKVGDDGVFKTKNELIENGYSVSVTPTADGGFCLCGDNKVIKIDESENQEWISELNYIQVLESIHQTTDGGYICGTSKIVKIDSNGDVLWDLSTEEMESIWEVIQTSNGGYISVGSSYHPTTGEDFQFVYLNN